MYRGFHRLTHATGPLDFGTDALGAGNSDAATIAIPPDAPDPLEGEKWANDTITWSFATSNLPGQPATFSGVMTGIYDTLVKKAVLMWESVANVTLIQMADNTAVDIRVGFEDLLGTSNSVGLTNWRSSGGNFLPDVTVGAEDPSLHGVTSLPDGDVVYDGLSSQFFQIVAHELGHALGLAHNVVDNQALMQPVSTANNRSIDPNDVAAIQQLYGPSASGKPNVSIIDAGPDALTVPAGATIDPFKDLTVSDGAALDETVTVTVTGDGTLSDPTAGTDESFANGVFKETGVNLPSEDEAQLILNRLVYTAGPGDHAAFNVEVDNSLDETAISNNISVGLPTPNPVLGVFDATTNETVSAVGQPYVGPVAGLTSEYINITADNLNISASTPNWFIHSGSGTDAIAVSGGVNVLDGGTGSNFLTGGTGTDTFFVDDRAAAADIWSTVAGFHAGDSATIWGVTPQGFGLTFADGQGAAGFTGLTLHATASGKPTASLTLTGFSQADMTSGRLSVLFGTDSASGSAYMYLHGNS